VALGSGSLLVEYAMLVVCIVQATGGLVEWVIAVPDSKRSEV